MNTSYDIEQLAEETAINTHFSEWTEQSRTAKTKSGYIDNNLFRVYATFLHCGEWIETDSIEFIG